MITDHHLSDPENTIKLGYNEHVNNEFMTIVSKWQLDTSFAYIYIKYVVYNVHASRNIMSKIGFSEKIFSALCVIQLFQLLTH